MYCPFSIYHDENNIWVFFQSFSTTTAVILSWGSTKDDRSGDRNVLKKRTDFTHNSFTNAYQTDEKRSFL